MSDQPFNLVKLYWVDPKTRLIYLNTDPVLPEYAYTFGQWYALYQATTQVGLYRLYDVTLLMHGQPGNPILTASPISPMLWQKSFTSAPPLLTAYADDVLRGNSWTAVHADLTTRLFGQQDRVYLDEDLYVTNLDKKFTLANTLFFVNGVYHLSVPDAKDPTSAWIRDGYRTLTQARDYRQIHAVDFTPLGTATQVAVTKDMITSYSGTDGEAYYITYPAGGLTACTLAVAIEGVLFYPGNGIMVLSDTVLALDPTKLELVRAWYQAPMLRRRAPLVPDADAELTSDVHETDLDLYTTTDPVSRDRLDSDDFALQRLTSPHTALLLLPKNLGLYQTPSTYETLQKDLLVVSRDQYVPDASLLYKGMVSSPTFLPCHSARTRSVVWSPWQIKNPALPEDDPNYKIAINPDYNKESTYNIRADMKLVQWVTLASVLA